MWATTHSQPATWCMTLCLAMYTAAVVFGSLMVGPQLCLPSSCRTHHLLPLCVLLVRIRSCLQVLVPHATVPLRNFAMFDKGGLPSAKTSLPSGPTSLPSAKIKWGDLSPEELSADPASPAANGSPTEGIFPVSSRADQRARSKDPGAIMPERTLMPDGKEGRSEDQTPPYKERAPSFTSSRFMKRGCAPAFVRGGGAEVGLGHPHCPPGGLPFEEHERPDWRDHYNGRADRRNGKGPALLDEHTRPAIAHTQLASNELQLRIGRLGGWPGRRRREEGGREGE